MKETKQYWYWYPNTAYSMEPYFVCLHFPQPDTINHRRLPMMTGSSHCLHLPCKPCVSVVLQNMTILEYNANICV